MAEKNIQVNFKNKTNLLLTLEEENFRGSNWTQKPPKIIKSGGMGTWKVEPKETDKAYSGWAVYSADGETFKFTWAMSKDGIGSFGATTSTPHKLDQYGKGSASPKITFTAHPLPSKDRICYRKLRKYKYQLRHDYITPTNIQFEKEIDTSYIRITKDGVMTIMEGYAWDGPSGPTVDTLTFMRASLIHDAFYQLIREGEIARNHKKDADKLIRMMSKEDKMNSFRAWYVEKGVIALGFFGLMGTKESQFKCAPKVQ